MGFLYGYCHALRNLSRITSFSLCRKFIPHVENELSDALRIYEDEDTSDQAKSGCYDLCSDDMWSVTVYIIRTDL